MNLSGSPLDFLWAFFGGVLISFTPCIYPLLPITIAYIGASGANSKIKGFTLSLIYVSGISVTYCLLGLAAVFTGSIFGQFSSRPLVRIIAGLVIILFGLSLWTGQGLRLPVLRLSSTKKPGTYLSCFILGLTSGLVISPCVAPALGSIFIFVATKRNFIYGALLLFSFAYGMGLLLILAGTFSSILAALPKSGHWMEVIKKVCAVILIAAGFYFIISSAVNLAPLDPSSKPPVGRLGLEGLAFAEDKEVITAELDFRLRDLDGNMVALSDFNNKKSVILFFWTTWCPFCLRELHNLNQIYPAFISEDIEVLAINVEESEPKVRRFLKKTPVVFKVLLDSDGRVAYSYGLIGVPMFVLINKSGEIVFQDYFFPQKTYKEFFSE